MSTIYEPASAASPSLPWNITILSQRDATAQIPINYVSVPAVSATAACFGLNRFEETAFQKCILNLLTTAFHRLIFDVYWDSRQQAWTFCPSEIPLPQGEEKVEGMFTNVSTPHRSTSSLGVRDISSTAAPLRIETSASSLPEVVTDTSISLTSIPYSVSSTLTTSSQQQTTITVSTITASSTVLASYPPAPSSETLEVLYSIGPYVCSRSINLSVLVDVVSNYLLESDNTLDATIQYLVFNLHVASSNTSPEAPGAYISSSSRTVLSERFESSFNNMSSFIYTPALLASQRADLNSSWLSSNVTSTDFLYFTIKRSGPDSTILTTDNGWPSGAFLAVKDRDRVLLSFGDIDPQLGGPETFSGASTIFSKDAVTNMINATIASDGYLFGGCISSQNSSNIQTANASWAFATDNSLLTPADTQPEYRGAHSLSKCGISPILNATLGDQTADVDIGPYQEFVYSFTWSWAPGQPQSPVLSGANGINSHASTYRCAAFDSTFNGSWHVDSCQNRHRAACRSKSDPFQWYISGAEAVYTLAMNNCPANSSFEVPRTPTENLYLLQAYNDANLQDQSIWINFNSLDAQSCWVIGADTTCPYLEQNGKTGSQIYIPTIAALIILIIASLTLCAKVSTNRARSKRRRRVLDGWNYEGVPS